MSTSPSSVADRAEQIARDWIEIADRDGISLAEISETAAKNMDRDSPVTNIIRAVIGIEMCKRGQP